MVIKLAIALLLIPLTASAQLGVVNNNFGLTNSELIVTGAAGTSTTVYLVDENSVVVVDEFTNPVPIQ
jgi:hypothetical protein